VRRINKPRGRRPELLDKDPQTFFWPAARGCGSKPSWCATRLLKMSGLLSEKVGGPSVFPAAAAGHHFGGTYGAIPWTVSPGEDRYRRGLYTFSQAHRPVRDVQHVRCTERRACVARREVSNTPAASADAAERFRHY